MTATKYVREFGGHGYEYVAGDYRIAGVTGYAGDAKLYKVYFRGDALAVVEHTLAAAKAKVEFYKAIEVALEMAG